MKILNHKTPTVDWMFSYNEGKKETGMAETIGGNIAGSKAELVETFNAVSNQRNSKNLKQRFIHLKVAISKEDGQISSRVFNQIATRVVEGLGYNNNPFVVYRHFDTDHPHIHIVLGRVTFDGKLIRDSHDGLRQRNLEILLEREFELVEHRKKLISKAGVRLPGMYEKKKMKISSELARKYKRKGLSEAEIIMKLREKERGEASLRNYVQMAHLDAVQGKPTDAVYLKRMERRGIKLFRHEFKRKDKVYYGLSYTLDPTLIRGEYQSKVLDGKLAGVTVSENKNIENHPYLGLVPATHQVNKKGVVQLCLWDTLPTEKEMKPVSFRASNLGPLFMHEELLKMVKFSEEMLLKITIDRSKKGDDKYQRESIIKDETPEISSLILAAEQRSESRTSEVLSRLDIDKINLSDSIASREDLAFIQSIKEKDLTLSEFRVPEILVEPLKDDGLKVLIEELLQRNGNVIPNSATLEILQLVKADNWDGLDKYFEGVMKGKYAENLPDPEIFSLNKIPLETIIEVQPKYFEWYQEKVSVLRDLSSAEKAMQKTEYYTDKLELALRSGDRKTYSDIILENLADLRKVNKNLLLKVNEPELIKIINEQVFNLGEIGLDKPDVKPQTQKLIIPDSGMEKEKEKKKDQGID